jgi:hypothetical protein
VQSLFEPSQTSPIDTDLSKVSHRDLYWSFLFQFHLLAFARDLLVLVQLQQTLELKRKERRWWLPKFEPREWLMRVMDDSEGDGERAGGDVSHQTNEMSGHDPGALPSLFQQQQLGAIEGERKVCPDSSPLLLLPVFSENIAGLRHRDIGSAQSRNPDAVTPSSLRGSIGARLYDLGTIFSTTQCEIFLS